MRMCMRMCMSSAETPLTCTHIPVYVYTHTRVYTCMRACVRVRVRICNMYTSTYIHLQVLRDVDGLDAAVRRLDHLGDLSPKLDRL